ncbi:MAG: DUF7661 family protein, partial [Hafnia alvei]
STSKTPSYTKSVSWQHHPQWLDDIYHEAATMEHPDVYRVE